MHELSIAHSILSIAERSFPPGTAGFICSVQVQVGELSSIDTGALEFAFSAIKNGTVLEKAELILDTLPGRAHCADCGHAFHLSGFGTACPSCNSFLLNIVQGKELKVLSLSVEEPNDPASA